MITTGRGGLTKDEIKEVLDTLVTARKQGKLPALSYEYRSPTFIDRRNPIFVTPEDTAVAEMRVKVRAAVKAKHGSKYVVA